MASTIKGITIDIGGNTAPLQKALQEVNNKTRSVATELKQVEKLLKLDPGNVDLLAQKQKLLADSVQTATEKLNKLKDAQAQVSQQFADGKIDEEQFRAFQREIAQAESNLKNASKEMKNFGDVSKQQLKAIGNDFQEVGGKISDTGKKMGAVSAVMAGIGVASINAASQYEDAMAKVSTIADTSKLSLDDLSSQIMDLSNETGIGASEIAENVYNAISAGQKTGDAVSFVANATKLAKAGFADSASATDILTTALNAYGLEAEKVTDISDLLIQTQNLGKTTVGELSTAMGKVIPTAKANNVQIDQLCSGYAILTAKGIATAEATTYMNAMLNELGKGGTNVDKILREQTGKSFSELSASGQSLGDVLGVLQNYSQDTQQSFTDLWGSSEAGKAGLVLLGDGAGEFNSMLSQMNNSMGAADAAFEKLNTNSQKGKIALNQIKNSGIELGESMLTALQPIISNLCNSVKTFTDWLGSLSESQKMLIISIMGVVAGIAPLLIIIGQITTGIGGLIKILPLLGSAFSFLAANPIVLIVAALSALVLAITHLWKTNEDFRNFFINIWEEICEFFRGAVEKFSELANTKFKFIFDSMRQIFNAFKSLFSGDIKGFFSGIFNAAKTWVSGWKSVGGDLIKAIWNGVQNLASWFGNKIKSFFSNIAKNAVNAIKSIFSSSTASTTSTSGNTAKRRYASGGVADFTGLAMLDGTRSRAETIFNATDSKKLYDLIHNTSDLSAYLSNKVGKSAGTINNVVNNSPTIKVEMPIVVEGSLDEKVIPMLENMVDKTINKINKSVNNRGVSRNSKQFSF